MINLLFCRSYRASNRNIGYCNVRSKTLSPLNGPAGHLAEPVLSHRDVLGEQFKADVVVTMLDGGEAIFFKYGKKLPVLSNQKYNAYLKSIADLCGIKKNLTTHLFRRTYATRLMRRGVRVETTAKALGHTDTKITLRHYAAIQEEAVIDEIYKAFSK